MKTTKSVAVSSFIALHGTNISRPEGSYDDPSDRLMLAQSLATRGVILSLGSIGIVPMTEEEIERAKIERQFEWQLLKASQETFSFQLVSNDGEKQKVVINAGQVLAAWEDLYTKGGEIIVPTEKVAHGTRRTGVLHIAQALSKAAGLVDLKRIEVSQYDPMTEDEFAALNIKENLLKTFGSKAVSILGQFKVARVLIGAGYKEASLEVQCGFARGTAQKCYALLYLDAQFPEIKLADRVLSNELPYSKFDKEDTRKLAKRVKDEGGVHDSEIREFIEGQMDPSKKTNKPKCVTRPKLEAVSDTCPITFLRLAFKAALGGDTSLESFLLKVNPDSAAINEALKDITAKLV